MIGGSYVDPVAPCGKGTFLKYPFVKWHTGRRLISPDFCLMFLLNIFLRRLRKNERDYFPFLTNIFYLNIIPDTLFMAKNDYTIFY